jgi:N,N-dimethylformamidase
MTDVIGYLDRWSLRAGEAFALFAHSDVPRELRADIVSLTRASDAYCTAPRVTGTPYTTLEAGPQRTLIGSYARLPLPDRFPAGHGTLSLLVKPTTTIAGVIAAFTDGHRCSVRLQWTGMSTVRLIDEHGTVRCEAPLALGAWSLLTLVLEPHAATMHVHSHRHRSACSSTAASVGAVAVTVATAIWLAAAPDATGAAVNHFDGLIEAPALHAAALASETTAALRAAPATLVAHADTIAAWDFADGTAGDRLLDRGPLALHGRAYQGPTRLVPGAYWRAGVLDPAREPQGFAAIHFHRDDLRDAGWHPSAHIALPASLPSGVYGLRLRGDDADAIDVIPFWVRAATTCAPRPFAYLAPTYTYLAYGNAPSAMLGPIYWGGDHPSEHQRERHREFGPSLYSRHPDHSGVSLVSRHRPVLTIRPGVRPWGFEADRLLTDWLDRQSYAFDVLTDEDLDADGPAALAAHRVIVTGNHPEYWTARMLDALEAWLHDGGRLLYIGGNGLYWRISSLRELPGVIECRRAEGGTRPWIAEPGCAHHQLDGEPGGLWRRLGRAPQQLVGVGFAGQGFECSAPYRIRDDARHSWGAFALRDVAGELIGTIGRFGGAAAGQEIDRHDVRLGSSRDAVVLASSQGLHDAATLRTLEELLSHEPYAPDPKVRADLTLTPVDGGGVVFATGSMAWVGALDDPSVTQVMRNVIDRFLDPAAIATTGEAPTA